MKQILVFLIAVVLTIQFQTGAKNSLRGILKKYGEHLLKLSEEQEVDANTYSNYKEVQTKHFDIDWNLDLVKQEVSGSITLHMLSLVELKKITLDMWDQKISSVVYSDSQIKAQELQFQVVTFPIQDEGDQGQQLSIDLKQGVSGYFINSIPENNEFQLTITYSFGADAKAVSFLTKEQTGTKTQPYLYSQCEPIYFRSMAPIQDTPIIKATYSATVVASDKVDVYMSANKTSTEQLSGGLMKHSFDNQIPIPSYLVAIIAGNVTEAQVGARTYVIAEPDILGKSVKDLGDLEEYLTVVEDYVRIPYIWGSYKIVIMPPSFPFGGMENPLLTFASPSIITGDKSGTTVAIHEIAHSWTGNMVTCANWSNMWLNEGFTVFLERKAQKTLFGTDFMQLDSIVGNNTLLVDISSFGPTSNYSSLYPLTAHHNPDDSFSTIPYEKGYQFLSYIQYTIGDNLMQDFISSWIDKNTFKSRVYQDLKAFFEDFIRKNTQDPQKYISKIDWETWVRQPGMPPASDVEKIQFHTKQEAESVDLAKEFIILKGDALPPNWEILKQFTPDQTYVFLGYLLNNKSELNTKILGQLQKSYNFNSSSNFEILWRWFEITIYVGFEDAKQPIYEFLGKIGRQKMILPQYTAYVATGQRDYAAEVFAHYRNFYHPIARNAIENILA